MRMRNILGAVTVISLSINVPMPAHAGEVSSALRIWALGGTAVLGPKGAVGLETLQIPRGVCGEYPSESRALIRVHNAIREIQEPIEWIIDGGVSLDSTVKELAAVANVTRLPNSARFNSGRIVARPGQSQWEIEKAYFAQEGTYKYGLDRTTPNGISLGHPDTPLWGGAFMERAILDMLAVARLGNRPVGVPMKGFHFIVRPEDSYRSAVRRYRDIMRNGIGGEYTPVRTWRWMP